MMSWTLNTSVSLHVQAFYIHSGFQVILFSSRLLLLVALELLGHPPLARQGGCLVAHLPRVIQTHIPPLWHEGPILKP